MFSEYFTYTNYILNLNSIDYTDYNIVLNTNGTNTITFTNLLINDAGIYQFTLNGEKDLNPPIIMIQGVLTVIQAFNPEGTKIIYEIYKKHNCINVKNMKLWTKVNSCLHENKKLVMHKCGKIENSLDSNTKKICKLSKKKKSSIKSDEKKAAIKYDFLNLENYQYSKNHHLNDDLLDEFFNFDNLINYQKN
jgi:hypothetical protein